MEKKGANGIKLQKKLGTLREKLNYHNLRQARETRGHAELIFLVVVLYVCLGADVVMHVRTDRCDMNTKRMITM